MTIEEDSILFLEGHIDTTFKEIFGKYLINKVDWLPYGVGNPNVMSAYATLLNTTEINTPSNIIVLFPPFNPNKEGK